MTKISSDWSQQLDSKSHLLTLLPQHHVEKVKRQRLEGNSSGQPGWTDESLHLRLLFCFVLNNQYCSQSVSLQFAAQHGRSFVLPLLHGGTMWPDNVGMFQYKLLLNLNIWDTRVCHFCRRSHRLRAKVFKRSTARPAHLNVERNIHLREVISEHPEISCESRISGTFCARCNRRDSPRQPWRIFFLSGGIWKKKKEKKIYMTVIQLYSVIHCQLPTPSLTQPQAAQSDKPPEASRLMLPFPLSRLLAGEQRQFWQDRSVLRHLRQIWTRSSGLWFKDHGRGQKEKDTPLFFLKVSSLQKNSIPKRQPP